MSIFITWIHSIDTPFRASYAQEVGEQIQEFPQENATHYMVGSERITQANQAALSALYGDDIAFYETVPEGW